MKRRMERVCWLCGAEYGALDEHHIFGGPNRNLSTKYGLTVYLCHDSCHENGRDAAHRNPETAQALHEYGQRLAMRENGWSIDDFRRVFGKNYLPLDEPERVQPVSDFQLCEE